MHRIDPFLQRYEWGHTAALQEFLAPSNPEAARAQGEPWAELWFGAHPLAPSTVRETGEALHRMIAAHPREHLGDQVMRAFGNELPFLLKLIAPAQPLSLQVHPTREHAQESFAAEGAAGIPVDSPVRNYRDSNHKPEMVLALEPFEALCGFRTPRKALAIIQGLQTPLARSMVQLLERHPTAHGMRAAFRRLISPALRPTAQEVTELATACAARLAAGTSPSPRIDRTVALLQDRYPGDPGVAAALLLNPVSLQPGEAMFVPAGIIHSYLSGFAVEIMATSDNVLRAGLTPKKVDADELLQCVSVNAGPPIRIAPEHLTARTLGYFAPIDDFELSVTTLPAEERTFRPAHLVPGSGPRTVVCVNGDFLVDSTSGRHRLRQGEALFIPASSGAMRVGGAGTLVQASVP